MKNTVNMDALKACAVLSAFNWFKVTTKTADGTKEFYATGIIEQHDGAVIKIEKQFATPLYMAGFKKITAKAENYFVFDMLGGSVTTVEGLEKDFADPDKYNVGFNGIAKMLCDLETLESLVDYDRSENDLDGLYIVLDLRKLGRITAIQEAQLKKFMNTYCNGEASKYQTPRTIYFRFDENEIYAGLWDYATENYMTEKKFTVGAFLKESDLDTYPANDQFETLRKLKQTVAAAI